MNSNISCAKAAGVNSVAANRHKRLPAQRYGGNSLSSIAVADARREERETNTTTTTTTGTNQRVALKSGGGAGGVDRLATVGGERCDPGEWLQCARTSANQFSGLEQRQCASESLCIRKQCGARDHNESPSSSSSSSLLLLLATNNSSQRGDATKAALEAPSKRLNCRTGERRQQRIQQRRRDWSERSRRAATSSSGSSSSSSGGSSASGGVRAAAVVAAPAADSVVFCCATEPEPKPKPGLADEASANRSTNTNNIQIFESAHERRASDDRDLTRAGGKCEQQQQQQQREEEEEAEEPDATFWAKLSNLSRSIIHQRQQTAVAAASKVVGCGTSLAPEVVGYLESKRRGDTRQCAAEEATAAAAAAADPTREHEKLQVASVDANEQQSSSSSSTLLCAQIERVAQVAAPMKSENMTTIKMPASAEVVDEHSGLVGVFGDSSTGEDGRTTGQTRHDRTRAIKSAELQRRTIKSARDNQTASVHEQNREPQNQVNASGNCGVGPLPVGVASSLEQLARKQAAATTRQQQQNQTAAGGNRQQPTTSNTTTTNTASSSTTRNSSASSLSSCILTETSTARSDRTQDAGGGGEGGGGGGGAAPGPGPHDEVRLKWDKKMDFLLSIIGFAVDLANIWRFPYLVYKNGGGVFLIPYLTMLVFGGLPLFFLELCLGQYVKKGSITLWDKICPYMKGVGYCSMLVSWYVSFYYNVLIAWSVYFIYRSVTSIGQKMPWEDCDNSWNSPATCVSISQLKGLCALRTNETLESCRKDMFSTINVTSPASEFFVKELSQIDQSSGLEDMGYLRTELVLCTMVVYLLHYFSLFRGLETSGKVVWVTATAPYMILSILLVRGLFLPGASMGIKYYLSPRLEKLADPQVWIDAAGQVFYSIGVGFGVHLTYASFNPHNNNCHRDCLVTTAVNALTSVYSGLVVFVYLGYMAANLGIEIDKVASEGYSLVFEVYPEALTTLPFARFWSILFFIMLLTLGIDSAMAALEAVITGLEDEFKFFKRMTRAQLTALVIVSSFLPALISCTQGGAYTLFWFDIYSAGVSLLFAALFETIGVVYCYGLDKFIVNIESMLGKKPHLFYILCWKYISPIFLMGIIFMSIYTAQVPVYRGYTFPRWSIILGWCLAFSSVSAVPIMAIWTWCSRAAAGRDKAISVSPSHSPRKLGDARGRKSSPTNDAKEKSTFMEGPALVGSLIGSMAAFGVIGLRSAPDPQRHQRHRLHRYDTSDPSLDDVREEMV